MRWIHAYHEAGHAIMAWRYGWPLASVEIGRNVDAGGETLIEDAAWQDLANSDRAPVMRRIGQMFIGGWAATMIQTGDDGYAHEKSGICFPAAEGELARLLGAFPLGDSIHEWQRDVRSYLERDEARAAMWFLANALISEFKFEGEDLTAIINEAVTAAGLKVD